MKTDEKKKGGMLGKHHPKDSNDQTALGWSHEMRKKFPAPEGCRIRVKFPDGPNGGTWANTKGQFRAIAKNGKVIGIFDSWKAARSALTNGVPVKLRGKAKRKNGANGVAVSSELVEKMAGPDGKMIMLSVADELENRAGELKARASALRVAAKAL